MTLLFDKDRPIKSPALAPAQDEFERAGELTIGLSPYSAAISGESLRRCAAPSA